MSEDITERKQALDALEQSEERFRKVFEATATAITISSLATGRFIDVNPAFEKIFGYAREEVMGRATLDVGDPFGTGLRNLTRERGLRRSPLRSGCRELHRSSLRQS